MTRSISRVALRLTACALLAASGCTLLRPPVDRSRFYILTSIAGDEPARVGKPITLGVGPVHLPDYLDRPEVVIRTGPNQIELSPTDPPGRSPSRGGFRRVFADNLSRLIATERIPAVPWYRGTHLDFQVHASVQRFDSDTRGTPLSSCAGASRPEREGGPEPGSRAARRREGADRAPMPVP
jgi:uncharacterized lipoprotein YmbA